MSGDVATMAADVMPYVTAAASAYGGAVLAKVRDDTADATVSFGRRILQRVFGRRAEGEPLPEPLADFVADPADEDAVAALRLAVRKALAAGDDDLRTEIAQLLAAAPVTITASGDRSVAAQHVTGSVIVTGDNADVTR